MRREATRVPWEGVHYAQRGYRIPWWEVYWAICPPGIMWEVYWAIYTLPTHPGYTLYIPAVHDCTGVRCMQCVRVYQEEALGSSLRIV